MLLKMDEIVALGEVMDYYSVINEDEEMLNKINIAKKLGKVIDGHAPLLRGELLKKYISFGISTDHESVLYDEALEKAKLGVKIMIREGSVAKNFKELIKLVKENFECFFVTDDILVTDLLKGHLDLLLNEALKYNIDPIKALKCVSLYPVLHYKLPVGLLRENDYGDFVIIKNLDNFTPIEVYINGFLVAKEGKPLFIANPKQTGNTMKTKFLEENRIKIKTDKENVKVNVIGVIEAQIITEHLIEEIKPRKGFVEAENEKDILKIVVVERYGKNNVSTGFIKGFGLKNCAIASSIAHDSHNIVAVGDDDKLIVKAVNELILSGGGLCLVNYTSKYLLPLPIAGLMSTERADEVAKKLNLLHEKVREHGCKLKNPFITLSFMTLLVIPELKISDKGLFNVKKQQFIPVLAE
jgi:Adenine deaminase